jgi:type II secretory pathway pseudopilin PulG
VPPAPAYTAGQETDTKAVLSLILGILAVFPLWLLAGIPAIVLGHLSKSSIRQSMGRLKGDGMATAGLIMGYFSVAAIPIVMIIAAIAIPNLLRAKIAANESAAASTVRTLNTAQVTYSVTYEQAGYAPSLEALGSGSQAQCSEGNAEHACLIDSVLGCNATWCMKYGYKFHISTTCSDGKCTEYVVTATPVIQGSSGNKSFCATSDGIVRSHSGQQPVPLLSADECKEWPAL